MRNNILILIVSIGFILFTDTLLFLLLKNTCIKKSGFCYTVCILYYSWEVF